MRNTWAALADSVSTSTGPWAVFLQVEVQVAAGELLGSSFQAFLDVLFVLLALAHGGGRVARQGQAIPLGHREERRRVGKHELGDLPVALQGEVALRLPGVSQSEVQGLLDRLHVVPIAVILRAKAVELAPVKELDGVRAS